jgi:hypothetical protein
MSDGAMEILWFNKVEVTSFPTVYIRIYIAALFLLFGVVVYFVVIFLHFIFLFVVMLTLLSGNLNNNQQDTTL